MTCQKTNRLFAVEDNRFNWRVDDSNNNVYLAFSFLLIKNTHLRKDLTFQEHVIFCWLHFCIGVCFVSLKQYEKKQRCFY